MKKAVAIMLTLVTLLLSVPLYVTAASGIQEKLDVIRNVYPTGSYFTVASSSSGCSSYNHDIVNGVWCQGCYLPSIPARDGLPSGAAVSYEADSCCGFASYVFYCLYGHNQATNTAQTSTPVFGDLVFTGSHWFIYLSEDSNNYYVYDANGYNGGKNKVIYNNYYPKSKVSSLTVYHANNYNSINNTSTPSYNYTSITPGTYYLKNLATGTYLCVSWGIDADKQNVDLYQFTAAKAETFEISTAGDGYKMRPLCSSSRLVNAWGDNPSSGSNVNIYKDVNDSTQWWKFEAVNGGYIIHNSYIPSCVLDTDGENVLIATKHGRSSQIWELVRFTESHTHTWNSGSVTKAPTCTATGTKTYTCTVCGEKKTESIAAKGHTAVTVSGTPATCTIEGLTGGSKCSSCGTVLTAQETIAALGHSFGKWSVTKQATCTADGTESRACSACGNTENRAIAAKGHTAGNWTVTESTCTNTGVREQRCSSCNNIIKSETVPVKEHNYTSSVIAPTPASHGYTLHTCTVCGDSYKTDYTDYVISDPTAMRAVIETKTVMPGDMVEVSICLENADAVRTLGIRDITYDASKLELTGGKWNASNSIMSSWDEDSRTGVIAFEKNTALDGNVFTLTFKVIEETDDISIPVNCKVIAREKSEGNAEREIPVNVIAGAVNICSIKRGDVNGDGYIDTADAIQLLRYTMMPDLYPINQNSDFNGNGTVDSDDAIYLLYHILMPDRYKLK